MSRPAFSTPALIVLVSGGLALFALSAILPDSPPGAGRRPGPGGEPSGPGSYSTSALGCAGFYDFLKNLGRPVGRNLSTPDQETAPEGIIILAEPDQFRLQTPEERRLLAAPGLLLVLPKRTGRPDPARPAWIERDALRPVREAEAALGLLDAEAKVERVAWPAAWSVNELGPMPAAFDDVQLIKSSRLRPLVASEEGILLGELLEEGRTVLVLAEPDLMANHGLLKGDNAAFMLAVTDLLRRKIDPGPPGPTLIFDETTHGFYKMKGSSLSLLFRFPLALVSLLVGLTAALAVWAGAVRFGAPLKTRPALDFGQAGLIANGARLLAYAGRQAETLRQYLRLTLRAAGRALNAPRGLDENALADWLDRLGQARLGQVRLDQAQGREKSVARLFKGAMAEPEDEKPAERLARLLYAARRLYSWKEEALHGSDPCRSDHRGHQG